MKLRSRLLTAFVTVAVFVLLIFGTVSYHIAVDSAIQQLATLFDRYTYEEAHKFSLKINNDYSITNIRSVISSESEEQHLLIIYNTISQKKMAYSRPPHDVIGIEFLNFPIKDILASESKYGDISFDGKRFVWAIRLLENPQFKLIAIRPPTQVASPFKTLSVRLFVSGIIIIWIAVWGALIIAAIMSRRLDKQNADLVHQALHDPLTDLPNRTLLFDRLQHIIYHAQRNKSSIALFVLDLDRFKEVNDTLGHLFGDKLLILIEPRLKRVLHKTDTVARLGGDEYAILIPTADKNTAVKCAENIMKALEAPFVIQNMDIAMQVSIGISIYPEHGTNAETLMRHADIAMYQAKKNHSGFSIYEPKTDSHSLRRLSLIGDFRNAILCGELVLYYQPKVDIKKKRIIGVEALIRWEHPEYGLLLPNDFIPLIEQTGLLKSLTQWVFNEAMRQRHDWQKHNIDVTMSVNLSVQNLLDMKLPYRVKHLLQAWDIKPEGLELEITESALMADPDRAIHILKLLRNLGVGLSIDDFGTGYSSFSYLKNLPVNELKIDKSFVTDMVKDKNDAVIVRSITDLGHNLGCKIVAEGVEDKVTLDALNEVGCDIAQGYHFGQPCPAVDLTKRLQAAYI